MANSEAPGRCPLCQRGWLVLPRRHGPAREAPLSAAPAPRPQDEPFSPAEWERHSSWRRHCPEPRICLRVFRMLSIVEAWVLAVATGVALYATFAQPKGWPVAVSTDYVCVRGRGLRGLGI